MLKILLNLVLASYSVQAYTARAAGFFVTGIMTISMTLRVILSRRLHVVG